MTIKEALQILKPFKDCMIDQHGCPISDAAIALDVVIKELENKEWIPCSERLPSKSDHKDDMVLVCYGNGSVRFNTCKNGQWCQGNPLAWMPLPEGWKGEE